MSKIGNYRIEMQETDDYRFGWESAAALAEANAKLAKAREGLKRIRAKPERATVICDTTLAELGTDDDTRRSN